MPPPPRVWLFTMDGCDACRETTKKIKGRDDIEVINVDQNPDRAREVLQGVADQGLYFEDMPKCVFLDDKGEYEFCDARNVDKFLEERKRKPPTS